MEASIELYGFGKVDRSGKVRWLAYELGLEVIERTLQLGEHRQQPYLNLNPYGSIPAVKWGDAVLYESTAILQYLAEQFPDKKLTVSIDEPQRAEYLQWLAVTADTIETKAVEYALVQIGLRPENFREMNEDMLQSKFGVLLEQMPKQGFLVGERFTIADINLAYSLRLGVNTGLLEFNQVKHYLTPLTERPAAKRAEFFNSLAKFL